MIDEGQPPETIVSFPVVSSQRCILDLSPFSRCQVCVDACPSLAWTVNKTGLDLDVESCDQCGLCISACPENAIALDGAVEPLVRTQSLPPSAFASCDRVATNREPGHVSCLHAIGVRTLAQLYSRGVRCLNIAKTDCENCSRKARTSLDDHLFDLLRLLKDRDIESFEVRELEPSAWREARDEASQMSRRGLLRSVWRSVDDAEAHLHGQITDTAAPGACLPNREDAKLAPWVPQIDADGCNACSACVEMCPHGVLRLTGTKEPHFQYDVDAVSCTGCRLCVDICDVDALELKRWGDASPEPLPLVLGQCEACGSTYYQPTKTASGKTLCRICAAKCNHQNLFQVLP